MDIKHSLDAFVDVNGRPLVHFSRERLRAFNNDELSRILYVGLCLLCHKDYADPVMKNWVPGRPSAPCDPARRAIGASLEALVPQ